MTKKLSVRFFSFLIVIVMVCTISSVTAFAASPTTVSGWGYAYNTITVKKLDLSGNEGTIYAGEGFTILGLSNKDLDNDGSNEQCFTVEFASPYGVNGTKVGYILAYTNCYIDMSHSKCATVTTSTSVWYRYDTSNYPTIGSISSGENVCVLGEKYYNGNSWYHIEYNTSSGRKRGWCLASCLNVVNNGANITTEYHNYGITNGSSQNYDKLFYYHTVYAGPGTGYAITGSIGTTTSQEAVHVISEYTLNNQHWYYITYYASALGKYKSGYIKE